MLKYFDPFKGDPFYSVYNVSQGTFASFKVMWRQMLPRITAAVVGPVEDEYLGEISPVTQHVVSVIAAKDEEEAHYLCAMLNSSITTCISASYSTGKSYGTPSMMDHVPIPGFSRDTGNHRSLAELSRRAHALVAEKQPVHNVENEIDELAADVFGVPRSHIPAVRAEALRVARVKEILTLPLDEVSE